MTVTILHCNVFLVRFWWLCRYRRHSVLRPLNRTDLRRHNFGSVAGGATRQRIQNGVDQGSRRAEFLHASGLTVKPMREDAPPDGVAEVRATARTNLFMAATLHAADVAHPVKIRDLSAAGAQIESSLLPEVGSEVTLARGRSSVQAHVTWCADRRCGLQFTTPISVPDWMASPLNQQQRRVDELVAAAQAGAVSLEVAAQHNAVTPALAAEDLRRVSRLLEVLGDALAGDPATVVKHVIQLQNLDITLQTLAAMVETIESDGVGCEAGLARLAELRISCAEALQDK